MGLAGGGTSVALPGRVTNTARVEQLLPSRAPAPRRLSVVREQNQSEHFAGMISSDPGMLALFAGIRKLAPRQAPVLIYGPSGTGKELIARALHDQSPRGQHPFLAINCGALAASIIESELFGHVKGAFTGAVADKAGAFEAVGAGTLFLDEVGELPLELQPKLLRVLEAMSVRRVGGIEETPIQVRVVAATHRNLARMVEEGTFREDLFHRLCVLTLKVPSLAARPGDILGLARHFWRQEGFGNLELSRAAADKLSGYRWPGNVRELRNVIIRAGILSEGGALDADDLQLTNNLFEDRAPVRVEPPRGVFPSLREELEALELQRINEALEACETQAEAAKALGVPIRTFFNRLDALGIARPRKSKP